MTDPSSARRLGAEAGTRPRSVVDGRRPRPRPRRRRLVDARRGRARRRRGRRRLRLPARRRRPRRCPTRARGASPTGVHGRRSASTRPRSRWTDDGVDRPPARRRRDLRAAHRHLHARGHARLRHRPARPPRRRSASTSSRCCRSTPSTARTTGATTACSGTPCRRPTAARRPTSGSSTPATRAASRVIQDVVYNHLGASRQLPARVRPVPRARAAATPGAPR